jgi:predicted transcriptional regulator
MVQTPALEEAAVARSTWFLLTNHGYVLLCVARDPTMRISEIARSVGIGERAAQKIVADLVAEGFLVRTKEGRRNRYEINRSAHPVTLSSLTWRSGHSWMCSATVTAHEPLQPDAASRDLR